METNENNYHGLDVALEKHIMLQKSYPSANICTHLDLVEKKDDLWALQILSSQNSGLILIIRIEDPDKIQKFKTLKTYDKWQLEEANESIISGQIALSKDLEKNIKYISIILHKVLMVPHGCELAYICNAPSSSLENVGDLLSEQTPVSSLPEEISPVNQDSIKQSRETIIQGNFEDNNPPKKNKWILIFGAIGAIALIGVLIALFSSEGDTFIEEDPTADEEFMSDHEEQDISTELLYQSGAYSGEGMIDDRFKIHVDFISTNGIIEGSYYYTKYVAKKRLWLIGNISNGNVYLQEFTENGTNTATIIGTVSINGIVGTFTTLKDGKEMPFFVDLSAGSYDKIEEYNKQFSITKDLILDTPQEISTDVAQIEEDIPAQSVSDEL